MSGVERVTYELRMRLFRNQSSLSSVSSHLAENHRQWDALQVERAAILAEFLELGLTPEEVLWDQ